MSSPRSVKPGGNRRFLRMLNDGEEKKAKLGHIPEEMMAYYRQVLATLEAGFDDDEPDTKKEFLNNVYQALREEGIKVSQNQTVSRILENLFRHSEPYHMCNLFLCFCDNLETISFDRFASHVFQSLIQYLPQMYEDDNIESSKKQSIKTSLDKLCQFVSAHASQFMTDTYGSHVLRSLLETIGGVHVKEEVIRSRVSRDQRKNTDITPKHPMSEQLSSDFQSQFQTIKSVILKLSTDPDHLIDANSCPVLQTVLLILHKSNASEYARLTQDILAKSCHSVATAEADKEDVEKNLPAVVQNGVGSFLIELIISLTPDTQIPSLYKTFFKENLIYFAVHPIANYVLQKLLTCIKRAGILNEIVSDISPYMEDILAVNHIGVIIKLAEACKKLKHQQEQFIKALTKAFHCDDPKERLQNLVPLVATMKTYDTFYPASEVKESETSTTTPSLLKSVNINGSLLLQQMLWFEKPKSVVLSLLALTPAELSNMAADPCGSHVVDAFFTSTTVWDRQKEEFLNKIKGFYTPVACSRNGSRCLEGIWKCCSVKMKALIAEELMKSKERIESDKFGHFLYKNFALFKFSSRKKEWMDYQSGIKKKKELLQAILEGNSGKKKRNRRKKEKAAQENAVQTMEEGDNVAGSNFGDEKVNSKDGFQGKAGKKRRLDEFPSKMGTKSNKAEGESISRESVEATSHLTTQCGLGGSKKRKKNKK